MEEDTGKSLHVGGATGRIHGAEYSLLDYNRAGVPLIEIVTKMIPGTRARAPEVARAYVTALRDLIKRARRLRRPDGPGLDALRRQPVAVAARLGGARHPHRDQERQLAALGGARRALRDDRGRPACSPAGGKVVQETRHFQEDTAPPGPGGVKETSEDYRYFPEPDLVPIAPPAGVGGGAARHPARAALAAPPADRRRVVADRRGAARPGQRGRAGADRGHRGRRRPGRRGPLLVGVLPDPAGQHPRRRAGRAADHPGPAGPGDRAGRRRAS